MPLNEAIADLLTALKAAVPGADVRETRRGAILGDTAIDVHRRLPDVFRLGGSEHVVHSVEASIHRRTSIDGDVLESEFDEVYDQMVAFLLAVKNTEPGGMRIYWPTGIEAGVDFADNATTGETIILATATIPLCDEYPRTGG